MCIHGNSNVGEKVGLGLGNGVGEWDGIDVGDNVTVG